jgi:ATP-binding cassette subfamily F protein uup
MSAPLLQLKDIALTFGGTPLLEGAELSVATGERVCLVGRNGSGKSTLLKIAAGTVEPDRGIVFVQPGAILRYLAQEPDFGSAATVLDYVERGLRPDSGAHRAHQFLADLGLSGTEDPSQLSGGEARRAAIARALVGDPDILLLDEPTNHLDLATIEWLERELDSRRTALVIISHDRRFLANLSRSTVWLDRGRTRRIERGFADFEAWRDTVLAEEERDQHKLDRKIVAEEHWLRYGVTARRKRNVRRLEALQTLREQRRTHRGAVGNAAISASDAAPSGALVIEALDVGKSYDGRAIVDGFTMRVLRGDRIGIVGPNGAGKTTLVSLLTGALAPDSGSVRLGANLEMALLDQHRDSLAPDTTVANALTGGHGDTVMVGGQQKHVVSYMKDFLFTAEQARTPLARLSGGERGRVMLAQALAKPSNLLVLDEPTNDLDMETLDVLEAMIGDYPGTVLLISHDRDFLDRLVSSVVAPEGSGRWTEYAGGYTDMLAQRGSDLTRAPRTGKAAKTGGEIGSAAIPPPPKKRRMTFNDKHALETLPKTIATLEKQVRALQAQLDDPAFFVRDRAGFEQASRTLGEAQVQLSEAEDRWLELEILREELSGGDGS